MSGFTFSNTWQSTAKLAGQSSGREVRHVEPLGALIVPGPYTFMNLSGEKGMGEDGKIKTTMPTIKRSASHSDKPEFYDYEVQQNEFHLTAAVASNTVGATVVWPLNSVDGIAPTETLHKVDQGIHIRVVSISNLEVTGVVLVNTSGEGTATADNDVARIEKLASANTDGASIGVGVNRDPAQHQNYLQMMISALTVGIIRDKVKHYAEGESEGSYFREEKARLLTDYYRMCESTLIAGQRYEEGSGATRRYYTGGLEWWAGNTCYNNAVDGLCSEDAFLDFLEDAMAAGSGDTLHFLCDAAFKRMVTSYQRVKKRVTDNSNKYVTNVEEWDTPVGTVKLIGSQFLNKASRRGSAISFVPKNLEIKYLRGLDFTWMGDVNLPNVLTTQGAYLGTIGLLNRNAQSTTLWGNFQG
jgi:hypothetical protein